jgi:hypothetical protein
LSFKPIKVFLLYFNCKEKMLLIGIFVILLPFIESAHFRGGSISWKPIEDNETHVYIEFHSKWTWRLSVVSSPGTGNLINSMDPIDCRVGCSGSIGDTSFYETSKSQAQDWISGEKKWNLSLPKINLIRASFRSCCWVTLNSGGSSMEVGVMLNTLTRQDTGRINSSPISLMPSILSVIYGSLTTYKIPIVDNDNDIVRCRWSDNSLNECGAICGPSIIATLNSSNCEILIDSNRGTPGWYGVSITIEDFINKNDTVPLSSVVIQFLIRVITSNGGCIHMPLITNKKNQTHFNAFTTRELKIPLEIELFCPGSRILEVQLNGPVNMSYTNVTNANHSIYETSIIWTPTINQLGKHLAYLRVIDTFDFESNLLWFEITVHEFVYNSSEWYTINCVISKSRRLRNGTIEVVVKKVSSNHLCDILDSHRPAKLLPKKINSTENEKKLSPETIDTKLKEINTYIQAYTDNKFIHFLSFCVPLLVVGLILFMIVVNDCIKLVIKLCYRRRSRKVAPLKKIFRDKQ